MLPGDPLFLDPAGRTLCYEPPAALAAAPAAAGGAGVCQ